MEIETYIIINMSCFDMIIILLIRAKLFLAFGIKLFNLTSYGLFRAGKQCITFTQRSNRLAPLCYKTRKDYYSNDRGLNRNFSKSTIRYNYNLE